MTDEGCALGRIKKFEEQGRSVVGVDDGERQYVVIGAFCNGCHKRDSPYLHGTTLEDWKRSIREFVSVRVACLIYADVCTTAEELTLSLTSLYNQDISPTKIVVVLNASKLTSPACIKMIREAGSGVPWEVTKVEPPTEIDAVAYDRRPFDRAIDIAVARLNPLKDTYYTALRAGHELPQSWIWYIDHHVNDSMKPLGSIIDLQHGFYTVLTNLHNSPEVVGNKGENIKDKLPWVEENCGDHLCVIRV